jgi:hypothetical protein
VGAGGRSSGGSTHSTNPGIEELKTRIKLLEAILGALSGQQGSSGPASNKMIVAASLEGRAVLLTRVELAMLTLPAPAVAGRTRLPT